MDNDQITALAREYAEFTDTSDVEKKHISAICENFLRYTLRRFCLVEKDKLQELEIARRAKEHGAVWLNQWEAESLFPDLTWESDPIEVELILKRKKKTENQ